MHTLSLTDCTGKRLGQRGDNLWRTAQFDNKMMKVKDGACVYQNGKGGVGVGGPPEDVVIWRCMVM